MGFFGCGLVRWTCLDSDHSSIFRYARDMLISQVLVRVVDTGFAWMERVGGPQCR